MNNYLNHEEDQFLVNCYKCQSGCIHLEYAYLMLTFSQEQFLNFSQVIGKTRQALMLEHEAAEEENPFARVESLPM